MVEVLIVLLLVAVMLGLAAGQGSSMTHWDMDNGKILYNSCYASWAGASLAHLTAVRGGWWEEM